MLADVNTKGRKTFEMVIFPKSNDGSLNEDIDPVSEKMEGPTDPMWMENLRELVKDSRWSH